MNHFAFKTLASVAVASAAIFSVTTVAAQEAKLRVGLMLPATGTFADLGAATVNGFKLFVNENGGRLAGREVEYFTVDDESDASKGVENANKLIKRDKVDVLVGTIHSGVALAMSKVARETKTLMIVPNAGTDEITGALCAPNIFRTSFSNWQQGFAMGKVLGDKKVQRVVTLTWSYIAGQQYVGGFKESFEKSGGKVVKEMTLPFPDVEFQAQLTEIAALKPDAVFVFFAGAAGTKFVKDYAAAGLIKTIPLYSPGFLTENLASLGDAGQGLYTTQHYGDGLTNPKNDAFRLSYIKTYKRQPDVYAVQGYDSAQLLLSGLQAVKGDVNKRSEMIKAMESARIDSPRGEFTLSKAHNPVQDFYLRQSVGNENKILGVALKALSDPARGCKM